MFRLIPLALALTLVMAQPGLSLTTTAFAAETKKKPQKKTQKKKDSSPGKGRSGYSAEERKRIMENARKVCREKTGASATVYRIDYQKMRVWCMPPGS
jgi:hypothetical protein